MKFFGFFFTLMVIFILSNTENTKRKWSKEVKDELKASGIICAKETNLSAELLEQGRQHQYPDDPNFKRFMLCMTKSTGMVKANGEPDKDDIRKKLKQTIKDDKRVEEIIVKCVVDKGSLEETAYHLAKCIDTEDPTFIPVDVEKVKAKRNKGKSQ